MQIKVQAEARRGGGPNNGQLPPSIIEKLDISDEQLEQMRAKADEVRKGMEEKIAKIRKQAEQEILSVLTPEQRKQYEEMMGETFDFGNPRAGFTGRGGGPGAGGRLRGGAGAGGRRGGGDRGGDRDDF